LQKSEEQKCKRAKRVQGFEDSRVQVKTARPFDKLRVTTAGVTGPRVQEAAS